jgi:hypothetical protein
MSPEKGYGYDPNWTMRSLSSFSLSNEDVAGDLNDGSLDNLRCILENRELTVRS